MRQLLVQVPRGCGQQVLDIANACKGANLAQFEATGKDEPLDVVIVHVSNGKVEELLEKLEPSSLLHKSPLPSALPQRQILMPTYLDAIQLNLWQMGLRAAVIYVAALVMVRLVGDRRFIGKYAALIE